ncbi:MAG: hypothetical protein NTW90_01645 [Nitrosospira sp.]|nr:hypothetical protein [Nitrosospira sp.]
MGYAGNIGSALSAMPNIRWHVVNSKVLEQLWRTMPTRNSGLCQTAEKPLMKHGSSEIIDLLPGSATNQLLLPEVGRNGLGMRPQRQRAA